MQEPCWVYVATNSNNGNYYIGISKNPSRRWRDHKQSARKGETTRFYNAVRKHGTDAFIFEPLMQFESVSEAKAAEMHLIATLKPEYNCNAGGDGGDPTPEVRKKISEGIRKSPKNQDRLKRTWETRRSQTTPEELSEFCSRVQSKMTPEQREQKSRKLREAQAARTPEREAERQRKRAETVANWTDEQKASYSQKISQHNATRVMTEEAEARIAEGQVIGGRLSGALIKGRLEKMTPEQKETRMANIVAGIKRATENRTPEQKAEITRKRLESRARNKAAKLTK